MTRRLIFLCGMLAGITLAVIACRKQRGVVYDAKKVQELTDKTIARKLSKER